MRSSATTGPGQSGPGSNCRAPFKCRLVKDPMKGRSRESHGWGTHLCSNDDHKMGGNGDGGSNTSVLSPIDIQKKDLAVLLFASLLSAEAVCILKPYWCHWRDSMVIGVADDRLLLSLAFQNFSKKLSCTLSNQERYRTFQKKLYKLTLRACIKLASCIVEWRIHLSMSLVSRALHFLHRINKHLDSLELAGLCSALRVLSEFYCSIWQTCFLVEALSQWYFQCQMSCMQSSCGVLDTELSLLQDARAASFEAWCASMKWSCLVSKLLKDCISCS